MNKVFRSTFILSVIKPLRFVPHSIYIVENPYIEYIQSSKYKLCLLKYQERESCFFEPRIGTEPLILKYPYIHIVISTDTYTIDIDRYKITQETIKKGDIYGGWQ